MAKYIGILLAAIAAIGLVLFFQARSADEAAGPEMTGGMPGPASGGGAAFAYSGKVLETMNAGGYTYIYVDTGKEKVWAAGPETPVEQGSVVSFPAGMEMGDFHSDKLDRTFEKILFVAEIHSGAGGGTAGRAPGAASPGTGSSGTMPEGHPSVGDADAGDMDFSGIDVPEGGTSIAGVYSGRSNLAGKNVRIRGRVVKFTGNVMGKNWAHIQDGSGAAGANDLTVTTSAVVNVGDVVLIEGRLVLDKDFGYGYKYEVLVEDATVKVESAGAQSGI